jgi:hypothetical protein
LIEQSWAGALYKSQNALEVVLGVSYSGEMAEAKAHARFMRFGL